MKFILLAIIGYFILKRVFKVSEAVRNDGKAPSKQNTSPKPSNKDKHGGEYVDYEEID